MPAEYWSGETIRLVDSKLWEDVNKEIEKNFNSNFHLDKLPWEVKVWLGVLVKHIDQRLYKLEKEIKERIIL